jgi:prephenate dehydrogenase
VDDASNEIDAVRDADLIVLATPVRTILRQLPRVGEIARDGALVLDLGSTKRAITRAMDQLPVRLFAVGGHPMCGKETSGFEAADASLYENKTFVLTPTARSSPAALATAQELAQTLGSNVVVMDAERHDQLVAAISHLPFVVASNLVNAVDDWANGESEVWKLAASGFRDTTRIAASDTDMMLDILLTNSENVADLMRHYSRLFGELADLIYDEEEEPLREKIKASAQARSQLFREKDNRR